MHMNRKGLASHAHLLTRTLSTLLFAAFGERHDVRALVEAIASARPKPSQLPASFYGFDARGRQTQESSGFAWQEQFVHARTVA